MSKTFHVCTIANDLQQYEQMKASFVQAGFNEENCRFSLFDNSNGNTHDPYRTINFVRQNTPEPYVIFCHQDVLVNQGDGIEKLLQLLEEMNKSHPHWAVLGNAGINDKHQIVAKITDPSTPEYLEALPQKVYSLDENFLILRTSANIFCSNELSGFHFYGTDLCLNAMLKGYKCFVIDFHITHLSSGNFNSNFYKAKEVFYKQWCKKSVFCYLRTTCTSLMILSRYKFLRYLGSRKQVESFFLHSKLFNPLMF